MTALSETAYRTLDTAAASLVNHNAGRTIGAIGMSCALALGLTAYTDNAPPASPEFLHLADPDPNLLGA